MSTSQPTVAATTTNTTRATTFSPSVIVNVWIGSTKYQLTISEAATAATTATTRPPMPAMTKHDDEVDEQHGGQLDVVASAAEDDGEQRQRDEADHDREQRPGRARSVSLPRRRTSGAGPVGDRVTGDHVDVEAGRLTGEPGDERAVEAARASGFAG